MFIILEGPDGAGKSTFAQALALELWERDRGTVLINPKRSPRQSPLIEYKVRLDFYRPRTGIDLILDRSWYSDDVYGPVWRGKGLDPKDLEELETWANRLGAVAAYFDEPNEVLERRISRRGDDDVSPTDVSQYADAYREQWAHWNMERVRNPSIDQIIRLAMSTEDRAKGKVNAFYQ